MQSLNFGGHIRQLITSVNWFGVVKSNIVREGYLLSALARGLPHPAGCILAVTVSMLHPVRDADAFAIANPEIYNRKSDCQGGEIGRRARFRIWWRNP